MQKWRGFAQSWGPCIPIWHPLIWEAFLKKILAKQNIPNFINHGWSLQISLVSSSLNTSNNTKHFHSIQKNSVAWPGFFFFFWGILAFDACPQLNYIYYEVAILLSHWRYTIVADAKISIGFNRLRLLRKASHWQLIQSLAPSTIRWCQCNMNRIELLTGTCFYQFQVLMAPI